MLPLFLRKEVIISLLFLLRSLSLADSTNMSRINIFSNDILRFDSVKRMFLQLSSCGTAGVAFCFLQPRVASHLFNYLYSVCLYRLINFPFFFSSCINYDGVGSNKWLLRWNWCFTTRPLKKRLPKYSCVSTGKMYGGRGCWRLLPMYALWS